MEGVKKNINKVLNIIISILIILLVINIIAGFQTTFLGKNYNNFFGYTFFEVKTGSMENTLNIGDWVLVKITDDIKLNDIITYEEDNAFITHRVIEIYKDTYITKGDSNSSKDSPVLKSQIVGKVIKVFPKFGFIKKTLLNPVVLILFIITLGLGISLLKRDNKEKTKEKKKKTKTKKQPEKAINKETKEFIEKTFADTPGNESKTVILSKVKIDKNKKAINIIKRDLEEIAKEEKREKENADDEII